MTLRMMYKGTLEGLQRARAAFQGYPAKLQAALVLGAGLVFFNTYGVATYWGRWDIEPVSGYRMFVAWLAFGNLLVFAFLGWAVHSLVRQMTLCEAATASLRGILNFMGSSSAAVYSIDLQGRCTYCNRACLRLLGLENASEVIGRNMYEMFFTLPGVKLEECPMAAAMRKGKDLHFPEISARKPEGFVVVECWSNLVYEEDKVVGAAVTLADVTLARAARGEQKRDNDALQLQVNELSQHSEEMVLFGQFAEMLQACSSTEELCKIVAIFSTNLFPGEAGTLYILEPAHLLMDPKISWGDPELTAATSFRLQDCWSIRRGKPHYQNFSQGDIFCDHISSPLPAFTFCIPLTGQGATLGVLHLRAGAGGMPMSEARQAVAITLAYQVALGLSNLKLKEVLREEGIRDSVTGLFNRRFMQESLNHEIQRAQRCGTSVGVISFDLDNFKQVNDTLGHAAGDSLLAVVANLAKGSLRASDISCRQGGDEFLLILPDISETNIMKLAENLRRKTGQFTSVQFPEMAGTVTLSVGVAMFPQDANTTETLQEAADQALYRAKTLGRNRVFAASHLAE